MKIETKFNIGDTVYYFDKNKIKEGKVDSVSISGLVSTEKNIMTISYTLHVKNEGFLIKNEEQLFLNQEFAIKEYIINSIDVTNKEIVLALKKELENYLK